MGNRKHLIIDACVLLNLIATGMLEQILEIAAQKSLICVLVQKESLFLRSETEPNETVPVKLEPLIDAGVLTVCDFENDDERQLFVNLALKLDDGEAMTLAIALSRNYDVATDDKKARRVFTEQVHNNQSMTSTSQLIRDCAEEKNVNLAKLKQILQQVELKARFQPPKSDVNFQWWNGIIT